MFRPQTMAFLPNGRDALIHMQGLRPGGGWRELDATYRVPLDGTSPPTMLYLVDSAFQVNINGRAAVFAMPKTPGKQECNARVCHPVAELVAYEFNDSGATRKTIFRADQLPAPIVGVQLVSDREDDRMVMVLELQRSNRALLRWSPGDDQATVTDFTKEPFTSERLFQTKAGEVIELAILSPDRHLEVHRYAPDGSLKIQALGAFGPGVDFSIHGAGLRTDGTLWVHLGNKLMLIAPDKPARAHDVSALKGRKDWASSSLYVPSPETVWLSTEGGSREFMAVSFAEAEKRAQPWPTR
jgi:hypothetical protein